MSALYATLRNHPVLLLSAWLAGMTGLAWLAVRLPATRISIISRLAICLYLPLIALVVFDPLPVAPDFESIINLQPGSTFATFDDDQSQRFQVLGNVALLVPLAVLFSLAFRRLTTITVLVLMTGISSTIEILQYLLRTGRSCDIDDVIANVTGCLIALVAFRYLLVALRHCAGRSNLSSRLAGGSSSESEG